jgi:hypothetical protein
MRLIFLFTKVFLFLLNINVIPFKIVPLGSYTPMETSFPLLVAALEVFNRYGIQHVCYTQVTNVLIFFTESPMSKISLLEWSQVMNHGFFNTILTLRGKVRSGTLWALLDQRKLEWANRRSNQCWFVFLTECKSFFFLNLKHPKECNGHAEEPVEYFQRCYQKCELRLHRCVAAQGNYFEGDYIGV